MTDPVDLLTRAAQRLLDLTDEALDDFEESHGEVHRWPAAMNSWLGGPVGEYAAVISHPTIGYALVDELRRAAVDLAAHLPSWRLLEQHAAPFRVDRTLDHYHGRMLVIARTILGEPETEFRMSTADG